MTTTKTIVQAGRAAFLKSSQLSTLQKNQALETFAQLVEQNTVALLKANAKDLQAQRGKLSPALYQRLKLDEAKITDIVRGVRDLIKLPDPVGQIMSETLLDEGLSLQKVSVPLGLIAVIFESRPDVLPQVLSLMLKSGNAVILKGGSEAKYSNRAFEKLLEKLNASEKFLPKKWAQLILSRQGVHEILNYKKEIALIIPRGSNALVQSIMDRTKIPVMGHAEGICHLYVHSDADVGGALKIAIDAKVQYPAACNAVETLLVHAGIAKTFLPLFLAAAETANLELRGDLATKKILPKIKSATKRDWATEYGELILSIKIVRDLDEALEHIGEYGSAHTDSIVAKDTLVIERFLNEVDSAGVFANASTRFADGFRYGLGAEVGVSTSRLHARGPVGLEGLSTYKYKLRGAGQVVANYIGQDARTYLHKRIRRT